MKYCLDLLAVFKGELTGRGQDLTWELSASMASSQPESCA